MYKQLQLLYSKCTNRVQRGYHKHYDNKSWQYLVWTLSKGPTKSYNYQTADCTNEAWRPVDFSMDCQSCDIRANRQCRRSHLRKTSHLGYRRAHQCCFLKNLLNTELRWRCLRRPSSSIHRRDDRVSGRPCRGSSRATIKYRSCLSSDDTKLRVYFCDGSNFANWIQSSFFKSRRLFLIIQKSFAFHWESFFNFRIFILINVT